MGLGEGERHRRLGDLKNTGEERQTECEEERVARGWRKPALFMTVRCEIAQSRREMGARSREGGRRTPCSTVTD
jgi:hypothetical protein